MFFITLASPRRFNLGFHDSSSYGRGFKSQFAWERGQTHLGTLEDPRALGHNRQYCCLHLPSHYIHLCLLSAGHARNADHHELQHSSYGLCCSRECSFLYGMGTPYIQGARCRCGPFWYIIAGSVSSCVGYIIVSSIYETSCIKYMLVLSHDNTLYFLSTSQRGTVADHVILQG